jgi:predicted O-methyltransferase YrrM
VQEFVYLDGWFDHYRLKLGERYPTFKVALNLLLQFGGKHIVETGTMRLPGNWYFDGCSTYLFAEFADRYGCHLWTCDLDERTIAQARAWTTTFDQRITYVCRDSIAFLSDFADTIDLLYLDSMDCPPEGDASAAQEHNLRELLAAMPHLSRRAIVLLDDNAYPNGGKSRLSKAYLRDAGWLCLLDSRQSLWLRPCETADSSSARP